MLGGKEEDLQRVTLVPGLGRQAWHRCVCGFCRCFRDTPPPCKLDRKAARRPNPVGAGGMQQHALSCPLPPPPLAPNPEIHRFRLQATQEYIDWEAKEQHRRTAPGGKPEPLASAEAVAAARDKVATILGPRTSAGVSAAAPDAPPAAEPAEDVAAAASDFLTGLEPELNKDRPTAAPSSTQ